MSAKRRTRAGPIGVNYVTPAENAQSPQGFWSAQTVQEGSVIYEPKKSGKKPAVYMLRAGQVRLYRKRKGAVPPALQAILRPGDLFGSIFDGEQDPEMAVASEGSEVWSVSPAEFRHQLENRPEFALDMLHGYARRVRKLKDRLWGVSVKDAPARIAEALLSLAEDIGSPCGHGGMVDLRGIIQQDLADMADISRSLSSTLLNELKRDHVLEAQGRTVLCIMDVEALRALARREKYIRAT